MGELPCWTPLDMDEGMKHMLRSCVGKDGVCINSLFVLCAVILY